MDDASATAFDVLCSAHLPVLKRYLFQKIANAADAEDVLQEVLLSAYRSFPTLQDAGRFKGWLIAIASRRCADYYKAKAKRLEIPLDAMDERAIDGHGTETIALVNDTLKMLRTKDKQILYLFYIGGYNQKDIARKLNMPLGTVKSRIHAAKESFRAAYPHATEQRKGDDSVNTKTRAFPAFMPEISIAQSGEPPFAITCEEIPGWLIVPRVGEKTSFAFYDDPDKRLTGINTMHCVREAVIHGVPCVQVDVTEDEGGQRQQHTKFMRLTDTHASYVAEMRTRDGAFYFGSFYDDEWLARYEVGEDNAGRAIHQKAKGIARINANGSFTVDREETPDIIGRYDVAVGSRRCDTVALLEICEGIMTILYIDANGRTVIFRRYNRFDWKIDRYKALWTEKLPGSEVLIVNGEEYVHWYDCIGDYVL